jgi:uncharacterized protein (TIGR02145 family)
MRTTETIRCNCDTFLKVPVLILAVSNALAFGGPVIRSKPMPDGKRWMTENLNLETPDSYCYGDVERNCRQWGRLYTWESAKRGCQSLGGGWRLPTEHDWREMAKRYGGIRDEAVADSGKRAFQALFRGGSSGFNALLGGGRSPDGREYARSDAHGLYWTASETGPTTAWFYNFGKGGQALGHHRNGEKTQAFSVRCLRD